MAAAREEEKGHFSSHGLIGEGIRAMTKQWAHVAVPVIKVAGAVSSQCLAATGVAQWPGGSGVIARALEFITGWVSARLIRLTGTVQMCRPNPASNILFPIFQLHQAWKIQKLYKSFIYSKGTTILLARMSNFKHNLN
jgi:hypothetical protein